MASTRLVLRHVLGNPYRSRKVQNVISDLRREDSKSAQSLGLALDHFINQTVSPDEKLWIEKIESIRSELLVSRAPITLVDYGIDPKLHQSSDQANGGRTVARIVRDVCKNASVPQLWGLLLFKLIRHIRPSACLELGTSLGISTAYQTVALTLNGSGRMMSLEGADALATLASRNLQSLGLQRAVVRTGRFQDTLAQALQEMKPIDFALIDGHHQEKATLNYFEQIVPFLAESAVLVFDDVSWSEGMAKAWSEIVADKRVKIAIDLSKLGICLLSSSTVRKQYFDCKISGWQRAMARATFG